MNKYPSLDKMSLVDVENTLVYNQHLKLAIADNMNKYGGSFVQALSTCVYRADPINLRRLIEAFTEYFLKYQPKNWTK